MQQAASQRSPAWADLQPELLLQVAALLGNKDRLSMMHTCESWYAGIAAGPPDLLPVVILVCTKVTADTSRAAALFPRTWHVQIEGEAQPGAAAAMVGALPRGVRWLSLVVSPCDSALLPALARISSLQRLTILGNGADIEWANGPAAVLAPLRDLVLDYRRPCWLPRRMDDHSVVEELPPSAPLALAAATALHTLHLRVTWSDAAAAALLGLPALRHLWLHLYDCDDAHAEAAVDALEQLPQLTGLTLGIHCCKGSEMEPNYPNITEVGFYCDVTPLASLSALTELYLVGHVALPPDFQQLANLQRFKINLERSIDADPFEWNLGPLTALTSLTCVEMVQGYESLVLPDAAVLASAPALTIVLVPTRVSLPEHAPIWTNWRAQLAALRPDVCITSAQGWYL